MKTNDPVLLWKPQPHEQIFSWDGKGLIIEVPKWLYSWEDDPQGTLAINFIFSMSEEMNKIINGKVKSYSFQLLNYFCKFYNDNYALERSFIDFAKHVDALVTYSDSKTITYEHVELLFKSLALKSIINIQSSFLAGNLYSLSTYKKDKDDSELVYRDKWFILTSSIVMKLMHLLCWYAVIRLNMSECEERFNRIIFEQVMPKECLQSFKSFVSGHISRNVDPEYIMSNKGMTIFNYVYDYLITKCVLKINTKKNFVSFIEVCIKKKLVEIGIV